MVSVVVELAVNNENYEYMHILLNMSISSTVCAIDCAKNYPKKLMYGRDLLVGLVELLCEVVVVVFDVELVDVVVVVELVELVLVELEAK